MRSSKIIAATVLCLAGQSVADFYFYIGPTNTQPQLAKKDDQLLQDGPEFEDVPLGWFLGNMAGCNTESGLPAPFNFIGDVPIIGDMFQGMFSLFTGGFTGGKGRVKGDAAGDNQKAGQKLCGLDFHVEGEAHGATMYLGGVNNRCEVECPNRAACPQGKRFAGLFAREGNHRIGSCTYDYTGGLNKRASNGESECFDFNRVNPNKEQKEYKSVLHCTVNPALINPNKQPHALPGHGGESDAPNHDVED